MRHPRRKCWTSGLFGVPTIRMIPMATRIVTRIGDIFEVPLDDQYKKYMQYIAIDRTQLNSSVVRAFKTKFPLESSPTIKVITEDAVDFYAHTVLRWGMSEGIWRKVGKSPNIGNLDIMFRGTDDILDPKIVVSKNWHVWIINGPSQTVGELVGDYRKAEIGSVKPANEIVSRMRTGEYSFLYPTY
jgi:hypothetical protein